MMTRYVPQAYRAWLTHGNTYQFVPCDNGDRLVTVTARCSAAGAVWLLYEHIGETLDLRHWVMPT
jgi:hypothetical protein